MVYTHEGSKTEGKSREETGDALEGRLQKIGKVKWIWEKGRSRCTGRVPAEPISSVFSVSPFSPHLGVGTQPSEASKCPVNSGTLSVLIPVWPYSHLKPNDLP